MVEDLKNLEKIVSIAEPEEQEIIPSSLTRSLREEDPEAQPFVLSYLYYNDKECGFENLERGSYKKALKNFRTIGGMSHLNDFSKNNIGSKPVVPNGEYLKLFRRLPDGVDLFEDFLVDTNRLFYFVSGSIFNIVAITAKHYETEKTRRR